MNNIQQLIFGCVLPANDSSAENMHYLASSIDTLEVEITSCAEDGDTLHSVFSESSMSSQDSDKFAEILKILATPQYDDLAKQVTNIPVFPQEKHAESSMSFQDSDPSAEEVTNIPVFLQSMTAESSMSSQGSDSYLRKKIKRTNDDDSSEAQQAQSKNADTACSKKVCMKIDGRKLEINGRIISFGPKESVFVKLLFEKINTHVPTDDLHVAVYGTKAGDWYKRSQKERSPFYSLLGNLRRKLPKDYLEGDGLKGYMLSDSVMTSQDSDLLAEKATNRHAFPQKRPAESLPAIAGTSSQDSASSLRKKIKRTNNDDSSKAQQAQSKTAYSKRACIDTDRKKLKINGRIISLGPKEIVFVKLLFEKINTYVSINDLYVAVYGGKAGGWKKDSRKEKRCFYSLIFSLRKKLPEDCFKSNPSTGYMLSDPVMTSQSSPSAREEIKRTPVQDKMVYSSGIGMNIEKKKLEIDGESFVFGSQEFMALKLLFEKINTYVSTNDLCVAVYGGKAGDWKKDSKEEKRLYKLFYLLGHRIPENYIKGNLTMGYMLSNSNDLVDVSYQGFEASPKKIKGTDDADSSKVSESEEDGGNLQKIQYDREKYPLIGECYLDDYDQFIKDTESIRSRYINVQKSPGFVRIGEVYISFKKNKVTIDGRDVVFRPREVQSLRFLALWYPDVVSYEQIYYNLSFRTKEDYVCYYEDPKMRKHYLFRLISCVRSSLKSATERDRINFSKGKGYSLVCCSNRQASPNESSVQDTIHSQSTDSSS